jgi:hypothetical protein
MVPAPPCTTTIAWLSLKLRADPRRDEIMTAAPNPIGVSGLAKTNSGVEFYLIEVTPEEGALAEEAEELLRGVLRAGDPGFTYEGRIFVAVAADVRGAGHATRRMLRAIRKRAIPLRTRLAQEPLPEALWQAAYRVVSGDIAIVPRAPSEQHRR